jgi:hypothetical protein
MESVSLPPPRFGWFLRCIRCNAALFYVRPERGVEHHFACRRCGQKHAAWKAEWEPWRPEKGLVTDRSRPLPPRHTTRHRPGRVLTSCPSWGV